MHARGEVIFKEEKSTNCGLEWTNAICVIYVDGFCWKKVGEKKWVEKKMHGVVSCRSKGCSIIIIFITTTTTIRTYSSRQRVKAMPFSLVVIFPIHLRFFPWLGYSLFHSAPIPILLLSVFTMTTFIHTHFQLGLTHLPLSYRPFVFDWKDEHLSTRLCSRPQTLPSLSSLSLQFSYTPFFA